MARRRQSRLGALGRALGVGLLGLIGVLLAAVAFFPFERLAPSLGARIERETRVAAHIDSLGARWSLGGPELVATGVSLRWPTGEALALDAVRVRAARLGEWLRGVPTAHVVAQAAFGDFEGLASREQLRGEFVRFDFARLPAVWFGEGGSPLAGAADAHVELARVSKQWTGDVTLSAGDGSLALPGIPVAIPFETLAASARLDEVGSLLLDSFALAGPMLVVGAQGEIAAGYGGPATGAIAITAEIERMDPALRPTLAQYGVALDANGAGRLSISGTPEQIRIR